MLSRCLPPSMVYPDGASNTHWGISPARQDTAGTRGKVKSKRREGYLTVEEIILEEENWRVQEKEDENNTKVVSGYFSSS